MAKNHKFCPAKWVTFLPKWKERFVEFMPFKLLQFNPITTTINYPIILRYNIISKFGMVLTHSLPATVIAQNEVIAPVT